MEHKVAIYCRLSEEDRNKRNKDDDSGSIQNQKMMLTEYAKKQNWNIYKIYSDDDYAGSDRSRPAFNQMISDARAKKFDIVLCKTQSRFTRELEIVEMYIHNLFPRLGIRFVSIVDNIDTDIAGNKKTRQINGLINEWYLEDMSDSIKSALRTRMKAGYFIGSFPPFGYMKDPDNKGHLIIDEDAADVVREIFRLYIQGIGRTQIARILNLRGIPAPEEYYRIKGLKTRSIGKKKSKYWKYYTVSHILENEVYTGALVQGKTHNPTYKSRHTVPSEKKDWVRVEDTHEAIIDPDTWNAARELWLKKTKPCYGGSPNIYSGVLICLKCGYHMGTAYNKHKRYYRCNSAKYGNICCTGTSIFESTLNRAVLDEVGKLRNIYLNSDKVMNSLDVNEEHHLKTDKLRKSLKKVEKSIEETDLALKNLYIDKLKGLVSEDQFKDLSSIFADEKNVYCSEKERLLSEIESEESLRINAQQKEKVIGKMIGFEEVTREFVNSFIKRIEIGGTRSNRIINIYWKF